MVKKNSDDRNIDRTYGIATSDTALKEMKQTGAKIYSRVLMFINKMMMESWQKITMVAYMLEHFLCS
jgi:hypothetical protein